MIFPEHGITVSASKTSKCHPSGHDYILRENPNDGKKEIEIIILSEFFLLAVPFQKLTYPTLRKGNSSLKLPWEGIC